ncbi:hypothetical protein M422DRAFT_45480 [Sphaerobolus stellatus SS14]|uniref:Uncharacterized protein n=1 Tax=Sphaerobolus stellatus (strain SS14) TaxID=990650 RepID=A0A0C9VJ36_SPHS4|nr:hypothetical protein M422DRAFT_45480 [Sphaerobolus stellatus SS14]
MARTSLANHRPPATSRMPFPNEIFHFGIIAPLLSEYLHELLVDWQSPAWNPFLTLPLVSRAFHDSCRSLNRNIFGLRPDDNPQEEIVRILDYTIKWWSYAHMDPLDAEFPRIRGATEDGATFAQLISSKSLIDVYLCFGQAKVFFNLDVMRRIEQENLVRRGYDVHMEGWDAVYKIVLPNEGLHYTRQYKMEDSLMHRTFRPLQAALNLCEAIPRDLAFHAAKYLAENVPLFVSMPLVLKHAQDLEMDLVREYSFDESLLASWTRDTLDLLETTENLIESFLGSAPFVQSFSAEGIKIPKCVIKETRITKILQAVYFFEWEYYKSDVLGRALANWEYFTDELEQSEEGSEQPDDSEQPED